MVWVTGAFGVADDPSPVVHDRRLLFVHVMKTAGTTVQLTLVSVLDQASLFPWPWSGPPQELYRDYCHIDRIRDKVTADLDSLRVVMAHAPYSVLRALDPEAYMATILRDPVSRTVSQLKQEREVLGRPEASLESVYEDADVFERFIHNHQTKVFALGRDEDVESVFAPIVMDDRRLVQAKESLEAVDLVGVTEDFDRFWARLDRCFAFGPARSPMRVSADNDAISRSFRRRIVDDNRLDMELYELARSLAG